jgi:multimeric flavodoxin WrbA
MAEDLKYSNQKLMAELEIDEKTLNRFKEIRAATIAEAQQLGSRKNEKIKVLGVSGSARDRNDKAQEDSNTEALLSRCLDFCKESGADIELLPLKKYQIEYCRACYSTVSTQCHFYCSCYPKNAPGGDDMTNIIYDKVLAADAIIFATPVNNFKMSTLMAAFLDRCISLDGSLMPANPLVPKDRELNIKHMKFIELTADNNLPGSGLLRRFAGKIAGVIVSGHEEGAALTISSIFMTLNHFGMLFPPFSNIYAMSSICRPTYEDKPIVLGRCHDDDIKALSENIMLSAKLGRTIKATDWKNDYKAN